MNAPDPTRIAANATALKVHLRVVPIGHTTYRVVTLRPSMGVRQFCCSLIPSPPRSVQRRRG